MESIAINQPTTERYTGIDSLNFEELNNAALILKCIENKERQRMIKILLEHQRMDLIGFHIKMRLDQKLVTPHLWLFRETGLFATERDGRKVYYLINKERFVQLSDLVHELNGEVDWII